MTDRAALAGKRILAVDDERDVLDVICEQLEGCAPTTAKDYPISGPVRTKNQG